MHYLAARTNKAAHGRSPSLSSVICPFARNCIENKIKITKALSTS
jgi:hypothetical protein